MTRSSNMQMSAAASTGNAGSEGTVAKSPVSGLPRPMEIGPQTPEEVKAKFGDKRKFENVESLVIASQCVTLPSIISDLFLLRIISSSLRQ